MRSFLWGGPPVFPGKHTKRFWNKAYANDLLWFFIEEYRMFCAEKLLKNLCRFKILTPMRTY